MAALEAAAEEATSEMQKSRDWESKQKLSRADFFDGAARGRRRRRIVKVEKGGRRRRNWMRFANMTTTEAKADEVGIRLCNAE